MQPFLVVNVTEPKDAVETEIAAMCQPLLALQAFLGVSPSKYAAALCILIPRLIASIPDPELRDKMVGIVRESNDSLADTVDRYLAMDAGGSVRTQ